MASTSYKRKDLTLQEKVEVIGYAALLKCSQNEVAKKFEISQAQVSKLLKRKDSILTEWRENAKPSQKRKRSGKESAVESELMLWFADKKARKIPVSGTELKEKAEEIARESGISDFKATNGWLSRWKDRSQISIKKTSKTKDTDEDVADTWVTDVLPSLIDGFHPSCIYNCNHTELYYGATPDGILSSQGENLAILCCANADGSHKMPLFVIGKAQNSFSIENEESSPVKYVANKNVWITEKLFKEWLIDFDKQMKQMKRTALLFLNKSTAQQADVKLTNVIVHFFPSTTITLPQPLDQEVISLFKNNYRIEVMKTSDLYDTTSSAGETSREISLLSAIQMMVKAWDKISVDCIKSSFIKCNFLKDFEMPISEADESCEGITDDNFWFVDSENIEIVFEDIEDTSDLCKTEIIQENDYVDGNTEAPSLQEVLTACNTIRRFLESKPDLDLQHYYKLEQQVTDFLYNE